KHLMRGADIGNVLCVRHSRVQIDRPKQVDVATKRILCPVPRADSEANDIAISAALAKTQKRHLGMEKIVAASLEAHPHPGKSRNVRDRIHGWMDEGGQHRARHLACECSADQGVESRLQFLNRGALEALRIG